MKAPFISNISASRSWLAVIGSVIFLSFLLGLASWSSAAGAKGGGGHAAPHHPAARKVPKHRLVKPGPKRKMARVAIPKQHRLARQHKGQDKHDKHGQDRHRWHKSLAGYWEPGDWDTGDWDTGDSGSELAPVKSVDAVITNENPHSPSQVSVLDANKQSIPFTPTGVWRKNNEPQTTLRLASNGTGTLAYPGRNRLVDQSKCTWRVDKGVFVLHFAKFGQTRCSILDEDTFLESGGNKWSRMK